MSIDSSKVLETASAQGRMIKVLVCGVGLFLAGVLYGLFVKITGMAIPCIFHLITGLKCPGCGVTRMCVALLQLDVRGAFSSHPMLLLQLPFLLFILLRNVLTYIKCGVCRVSRKETIVIYICIALLIGFTVLRNIIEI